MSGFPLLATHPDPISWSRRIRISPLSPLSPLSSRLKTVRLSINSGHGTLDRLPTAVSLPPSRPDPSVPVGVVDRDRHGIHYYYYFIRCDHPTGGARCTTQRPQTSGCDDDGTGRRSDTDQSCRCHRTMNDDNIADSQVQTLFFTMNE